MVLLLHHSMVNSNNTTRTTARHNRVASSTVSNNLLMEVGATTSTNNLNTISNSSLNSKFLPIYIVWRFDANYPKVANILSQTLLTNTRNRVHTIRALPL